MLCLDYGALGAPIGASNLFITAELGIRSVVVVEDACGSNARNDAMILNSEHRVGPEEGESALLAHTALAETAVVAAPGVDPGAVVVADARAISGALVNLPRTVSGRLRRAALHEVVGP